MTISVGHLLLFSVVRGSDHALVVDLPAHVQKVAAVGELLMKNLVSLLLHHPLLTSPLVVWAWLQLTTFQPAPERDRVSEVMME